MTDEAPDCCRRSFAASLKDTAKRLLEDPLRIMGETCWDQEGVNFHRHNTTLMKKHKHHVIPRHKGGEDSADNLILLDPVAHAELHALRFLNGEDDYFDFRQQGWPFVSEDLQIRVREHWSQKFSDENPMKDPKIAEKVASQRRGIPGANLGSRWNDESRNKIQGEGNPNFGGGCTLDLSYEQRAKISDRMKKDNPMKKPEVAAKVSAKKKGQPSSRLGATLTEETKEKLSLAMTGKTHTEASKAKMSASRAGQKRGPYKKWSEEDKKAHSQRMKEMWEKRKNG